jgi:hypothetical protein
MTIRSDYRSLPIRKDAKFSGLGLKLVVGLMTTFAVTVVLIHLERSLVDGQALELLNSELQISAFR